MTPSVSVLSCPFPCNIASIVCQIIAFEFFSSLLLIYSHSAFSNFMQKSVMSQNMANPSMFPLPIQFSNCLSSCTLLKISSVVTLSSHLFLSSPSTFQRLLIFFCPYVHVFAAYSATLQTKHFCMIFLHTCMQPSQYVDRKFDSEHNAHNGKCDE